MDARLHTLYRPIQINGIDPRTYYVERDPSPTLTAYVACYWESGTREYKGHDTEAVVEAEIEAGSVGNMTSARVLPDGCTDILITYDPVLMQHSYGYCGNYMQPFSFPSLETAPLAGEYTFGVRFFPGGASFLHGLPLDLFTDRRVSLEECWPEKWDELRERIGDAQGFAQRVQLMDQYLRRMLIRRSGTDADQHLIKNVLHRIFKDGGRMSVQEIAQREVVSERQLHRKITEQVGISPKRFSEIVRFQRVLRDIHQGRFTDGVTLAQTHGFYDQAHLIRQFRKFYGDTPLTAVREHAQMLSEKYNKSAPNSVILES